MTFAIRTFRTGVFTLALALLLVVCAPAGHAQNITGEIDGVVTDSTGALVPGATITVTDIATKKLVRTVTSNGKGSYTAALLAVGDYSLNIAAAGFEATSVTLVTVNVGETATTNVSLKSGNVNETVTVEASTTAPNVETPENSAVINESQLKIWP